MKSANHNHGCVKSKASGTTIDEPYGKDSSDYSGAAGKERRGGAGGGKTDISHSIESGKAHQDHP